MHLSPATRSAQATLAARIRDHGPESPETAGARTGFVVSRLLDQAHAAVEANGGPLDLDHVRSIALTLAGGVW